MLDPRRSTLRGCTAAAAAFVAVLLPSLVAPPASASTGTSLVTLEPLGHSGSGAAGVCLLYRVVPRNGAYEETVTSPGQGAVTVTLTELGDLAQQDVDFCTTGGAGDTWVRAPRYATGQTSAPTTQVYNPGETLTPEEAANPVKARQDAPPSVTSTSPAPGRPDIAAVEPGTSSATPGNNVKSQDKGTIGYDADAGGYVFGVAGLTAGNAQLSGFFDRNGDGEASTGTPSALDPAGDVWAEPVDLRLTAGGAPWSLSAANAARVVEATPKTASVVAGSSSGVPLTAVVRNAEGHPLSGVAPRVAVEEGPNAGEQPTGKGTCGASDAAGRASCTYTAGSPGTDTVVLWVNQGADGATAGRDAGEPFDTVSVRADAPTTTSLPTASASPSSTQAPAPQEAESARSAPSPTDAPPPTREARVCATSTTVQRNVMTAMQSTEVVVQAAPGAAVQLLAYSRPSTTYRVVREGVAASDGRLVFAVRPLTSTRLYAIESGCPASESQVVQVRSALSLGATRVGVRDFVFRGRAVPARTGQLVSLYRTTGTGRHVLSGQARVDGTGTWALRRAFSGTGRFGFLARTGSDLVNAAGTSAVRVVDVR